MHSGIIVTIENNGVTGMTAIVHNPGRGYSLLFYVGGVPSDLWNVVAMMISDAKIKARTFALVY